MAMSLVSSTPNSGVKPHRGARCNGAASLGRAKCAMVCILEGCVGRHRTYSRGRRSRAAFVVQLASLPGTHRESLRAHVVLAVALADIVDDRGGDDNITVVVGLVAYAPPA